MKNQNDQRDRALGANFGCPQVDSERIGSPDTVAANAPLEQRKYRLRPILQSPFRQRSQARIAVADCREWPTILADDLTSRTWPSRQTRGGPDANERLGILKAGDECGGGFLGVRPDFTESVSGQASNHGIVILEVRRPLRHVFVEIRSFGHGPLPIRSRGRALDPDAILKGLSPAGYELGDTVMADEIGRQVLAGSPPPAWNHRAVVLEGLPDFLSWSIRYGDAAEELPAVLGIVSGSWDVSIARRLKEIGTEDLISLMDDDTAGDGYAKTIARSVA